MIKILQLSVCSCILFFGISVKAQNFNLTELSGEYSVGGQFFGGTITLKSDGTYQAEAGGCTDDFFSFGTYEFDAGTLIFKPLKSVRKDHRDDKEYISFDYTNGDIPKDSSKNYEMIPIRWSKRIYLISRNEMDEFANSVNLGIEPRKNVSSSLSLGLFYIKINENSKIPPFSLESVVGFPNLPFEGQSLLLKRPIVAKVVSVEGKENKIAVIDKGKTAGLKVGMQLLINNEEPSEWSGIKIISVENRSAKGEVGTFSKVKIGDNVSSKFIRPKNYFDY